ncbi:hypothetical protein N027_00890 [Pseudomonas syringae USA007]|uniref:AP2-like integrase N-terminal domain-containing protein n=1 Tax=Pseudomonas syringae USA007 TaxID=1357288 RepID=A0AAU8M9L9_PSESX|nr:hypothetical protein [Pseudomonas syringae]
MALLPEISPSPESRFPNKFAMLHGGEGVWNGDNQESQPGARKAQWEAQICRKGYPAQRKTFKTKSDAQAWARMIESEIDTSKKLPKPKPQRVKYRPPETWIRAFPMEFHLEVI